MLQANCSECSARRPANRHLPRLASFAEYRGFGRREIDPAYRCRQLIGRLKITGVERHQFGQPKSAGIKQLDDRMVTASKLRFIDRPCGKHDGLVGRQRFGQTLDPFRPSYSDDRIRHRVAALAQPAIHRSPRRQRARDRCRRQTARVKLRHVPPNVVCAQRCERSLVGKLDQALQVRPIRCQRMPRCAPLCRKFEQESVDQSARHRTRSVAQARQCRAGQFAYALEKRCSHRRVKPISVR